MKLILPWPPAILSPNSRAHWAVKHRAQKKYKADCLVLIRAQAAWKELALLGTTLKISFHPPVNREHDLDNLISRFKYGQDALAEAFGVNDRVFRPEYALDVVCKNGRVEVTV